VVISRKDNIQDSSNDDSIEQIYLGDQEKLSRDLDNDEEYESRKGGFSSALQKMFRSK